MATVVTPYVDHSWDAVPGTIEKLVGTIMQQRDQAKEDEDAQILAQTPPDQLADIVPQLKSSKMKQLALGMIFKDRPQDVYMPQGDQLVKVGSIPGSAQITKPDPTDAILLRGEQQDKRLAQQFTQQEKMTQMRIDAENTRQAMIAQRQQDLADRTDQRNSERDARTTERMLTLFGLKQDAAAKKAEADPNQFQNWSPEEKQTAYEQVQNGGKQPQFGWGQVAAASRNAFNRGYADYIVSRGMSGAQSEAEKAVVNADKKSLTSIQKGVDAIDAFEKGVDGAFKIVEDVSSKYDRGAYPTINKFKQLFSYHLGDPDVKALKNAIETSMTEYMKVTTAGQNVSSSELSVGAQERAKRLLDSADSPESLKAAIEVMRREARNKVDALHDQRDQIVERISKGNRLGPAPAPKATTTDTKPAETGSTGGAKQPPAKQAFLPGDVVHTPYGDMRRKTDGTWEAVAK
jgi:hypothetical protein